MVSSGDELSAEAASGLERIRAWLQDGPLQISDSHIDDAFASRAERSHLSDDRIVRELAAVTATVGHVALEPSLLVAIYYILLDGSRIWA